MIALLQRVTRAAVMVDGRPVAAIERGILALVCAEREDTLRDTETLLGKVLRLRMFSDAEGKMNRDVAQVGGALLLVPQFTLAADTDCGTRPSFTPAAPSALGRELFEAFVAAARAAHARVEVGVFGADMQVSLVNDGPVTFWLQVPAARAVGGRGRA